jgi:catechol 2,3-dioxygenase
MTIHPATGIGIARLTVRSLKHALAFYSEVLGLTPHTRADGATALFAGDRPLFILDERPDAQPRPSRSTGLYHAAILLPTRRDLARTLRRLAEVRYPLTGASDHRVSEALYLDDPDGNGLEIYADRPRAAWPTAGPEVRMTVDPLDIDNLRAEDDAAPWSGLPAGTILGHIHLHVADLPSAEAFYVDLLGFSVMQRFGSSALFVAAGGYHHHLGLNTWAGVGSPPPPPNAVGLAYFTIHLPDEAARAAVIDRIRAANYPHEPHPDGIMLRDPAQNALIIA